MAKLTRSNSLSALVAGEPSFSAGTGRLSISIANREGDVTYHLHLCEAEARRFAAVVTERSKVGA